MCYDGDFAKIKYSERNMTHGTSHLLIGWGGGGGGRGGSYFQGEGQEKILLCKGGHYMKNTAMPQFNMQNMFFFFVFFFPKQSS